MLEKHFNFKNIYSRQVFFKISFTYISQGRALEWRRWRSVTLEGTVDSCRGCLTQQVRWPPESSDIGRQNKISIIKCYVLGKRKSGDSR